MQVEEIATEKHTIKLNCDLHFLVFIKINRLVTIFKENLEVCLLHRQHFKNIR